MQATYSPDDNKLRLYADGRLDTETFQRVKAAGFRWAPKQELFVAPAWTPEREDLLIELAGEVEDEDTSLVDRAEQRAERFEDYSDKRSKDYERAIAAADKYTEPFRDGQPILVGHHSEKRARKDQERGNNAMRRAINAHETAKYWEHRAAGAIAAAKYKELPAVRSRRIKRIEADLRKKQKQHKQFISAMAFWADETVTLEKARHVAGITGYGLRAAKGTEGHDWSAWDVLRQDGERYATCPSMTLDEVRAVAAGIYPEWLAWAERWISHYNNRLTYERAMLDEQGGTIADRTAPEKSGAVQCLWSPRGGWAYIVKVNKVTVSVRHSWGAGRVFKQNVPTNKLRAVMSAADVQAAREAGTLHDTDDGIGFYLTTDVAKQKPTPKPEASKEVEGMRDMLASGGVQVVVADQLFPTPADLAARMVALADIHPSDKVLEPSAGTGSILRAIVDAETSPNLAGSAPYVTAVEINPDLFRALGRAKHLADHIYRADFLQCSPVGKHISAKYIGKFDAILMNPPFSNGEDIKHILHAVQFLNPGGRLVAICANGPRQQKMLKALADRMGGEYETLPVGTFKAQGTNVSTALLTITAVSELQEKAA